MKDEKDLEELIMVVPSELGSDNDYVDPEVEKLRRETQRYNAQARKLRFLTNSLYVAAGIVFGVAAKYSSIDLDTALMYVVGGNIVGSGIAFTKTYKGAPNKIEYLKYILKGTTINCACFLSTMYGSSYLLK